MSARSQAEEDPRIMAAIDMLGRTGAAHFQIRYCEEEDPTVWIASALWGVEPPGTPIWETAAGMNPWRAIFRLCEAVMDGGTCVHCGKPTSVDERPADATLHKVSEYVCFYRYDPELRTFRRECEGVHV